MIRHFILSLLLLNSCGSTNNSTQQDPLTFEILLERSTGGRTSEHVSIISNLEDLEQLYNEVNASQQPSISTPDIDFNSETVLAFFIGEKNTGGYSIQIESINELENKVNVAYKTMEPKPTDMVTMVITQPYCIIKMEKVNKPLHFIKIE